MVVTASTTFRTKIGRVRKRARFWLWCVFVVIRCIVLMLGIFEWYFCGKVVRLLR